MDDITLRLFLRVDLLPKRGGVEYAIFTTWPMRFSVADFLKVGDDGDGLARRLHGSLSSSDRNERAGVDTGFIW